jgi:hypothetical protein
MRNKMTKAEYIKSLEIAMAKRLEAYDKRQQERIARLELALEKRKMSLGSASL